MAPGVSVVGMMRSLIAETSARWSAVNWTLAGRKTGRGFRRQSTGQWRDDLARQNHARSRQQSASVKKHGEFPLGQIDIAPAQWEDYCIGVA